MNRIVKTKRRGLSVALAFLFAVLLGVIGIMIPHAAEANPTAAYEAPKEYIESHIDEEIAPVGTTDDSILAKIRRALGLSEDHGLNDTGERVLVKYTLADANKVSKGTKINEIFETEKNAWDVLITQVTNVASVYDTGDEASNYYVAFLDQTRQNDGGEISDVVFAEMNTNGELVDGIIYDYETGLAYIPKSLYKNSGEDGHLIQAQMLTLIDYVAENDANQVEVLVNSESKIFGVPVVAESQMVSADAISGDLVIPVVNEEYAGRITKDNIAIYDGDIVLSPDGYTYDAVTGEVAIALSSISVSTIRVELNTTDTVGAIINAALTPKTARALEQSQLKTWPWGQLEWTKDQFDNAKVGDSQRYKGYIHYGDYGEFADFLNQQMAATAPYGYGTSQDDLLFNTVKNGGTFESVKDAVTTLNGAGLIDFILSLPADASTADQNILGGSWAGVVSYDGSKAVNAAANCVHVSAPISGNGGPRVGTIQATILGKGVTDEMNREGYLLVGFITDQVYTQTGVAAYKFKVKWPQTTSTVSIQKRWEGIQKDQFKTVDFSGAVFGIYTNDKAQGQPLAKATLTQANSDWHHLSGQFVDSSGKPYQFNAGTYFVKEISIPNNIKALGGEVSNDIHYVTVDPSKSTNVLVDHNYANDRSKAALQPAGYVVNEFNTKHKITIQKNYRTLGKGYDKSTDFSGIVFGVWKDIKCEGEPLSKATIEDQKNEYHHGVGTFVDSKGKAYDFAPGRYYVKELSVPEELQAIGVKLDTTVHYVDITSDSIETLVDYNYADNPSAAIRGAKGYVINEMEGVVTIRKIDDSGKELNGAKFGIFKTEADAKAKTNVFKTVEIVKDGEATVRLPLSGSDNAITTYYVRELEPPAGYTIAEDVISKIDIEVGEPMSVIAKYTNDKLTKLAKNGQFVNTKISPETVQMTVVKKWYAADGTEIKWPSDVPSVDVKVKYANNAEETITLDAKNVSKKSKQYELVEGGKWTVDEVKVESYTTEIEVKGTIATIKNTGLVNPGRIKKVVAGGAAAKLDGIEFTIYSDEACTKVVEVLVLKDGKTEVMSSEIPVGTYYVKETKAPSNFKPNAKVYTLNVLEGKVSELTIENNLATHKLLLKKVSSDAELVKDNAMYSLAGAEYLGWTDEACTKAANDANGKQIRFVTKADGSTSAVEVLPGTYYIKEKTASAGYKLDEKVHKAVVADSDVTITSTEVPTVGSAELNKVNEKGEGEATGNASLAGAEFEVKYWDNTDRSGSPKKTYTVTTNNDGYASLGEDLLLGSYTLTETKAPEGFMMDSKPVNFVVGDKLGHKFTIKDTTITGKVAIQKLCADQGNANSGDSLREGIKFELRNNSKDPVVVDGNEIKSGGTIFTGNTDAKGYLECPYELPYGSYQWIEIDAGRGYLNDSKAATVNVDLNAQTNSRGFIVGTATDTPVRGGLAVQKFDADLNRASAQGDLSLEGAKIEVVNASKANVKVAGKNYKPGDVVATLTTDASGKASTSASALPFGTYTLREVVAPAGYNVDAEWSPSVEIREGREIVSVEKAMSDKADIYASISVHKANAETSDNTLSGDQKDWSGFVFQVVNKSQNPIVYKGKEIAVDGVVATMTTDASGNASLPKNSLVTGTYEVSEIAAPENYVVNKSWKQTVVVSADESDNGRTFELNIENNVKRENMKFTKIVEGTEIVLPDVYWLVTSNTTGESHIVKTGEAGVFDSASMPKNTSNTNASDAVMSADDMAKVSQLATSKAGKNNTLDIYELNDIVGSVKLDESKYDENAGLWFFGNNEGKGKVSDSRASFAHDTYTVQELPCKANANYDYELARFEVAILNNAAEAVDMGEVTDKADPVIRTKAVGPDGEHIAPSVGTTTITDTVSYTNVHAGEPYRMEGTLHATDGTKDLGVIATAEPLEFIAEGTSGTVEISFTIDTKALEGTKTVAFERLFQSTRMIAKHENPSDEGQTVDIPKIRTTLADKAGNHEIKAVEDVTVIDTVTYQNLVPGLTYEVSGKLMDKETGKPFINADGSEVVASRPFTPKQANGSVDLAFTFKGVAAEGKTIVAFEKLSFAGREYAVHADINDEAQTVNVPKIRTTANAGDGTKVVERGEKVVVIDTVTYENLTPGATYTMVATPHLQGLDGSDEGAIPVANVKTFTADASGKGSVEVSTTIDTTTLAGRKIVFFEDCLTGKVKVPDGSWKTEDGRPDGEGRSVAEHSDITDKDQTVVVPEIRTTATDKVDGDHKVTEGEFVSIVDTVEYRQVQPGKTYTITGILMDKATNEPVLVDGKQVSAKANFDASSTGEGSATITFNFDARGLGRHDLVAFETLSSNDIEYAVHADINDEAQTVHVNELSYDMRKYRVSEAPVKGDMRFDDEVENTSDTAENANKRFGEIIWSAKTEDGNTSLGGGAAQGWFSEEEIARAIAAGGSFTELKPPANEVPSVKDSTLTTTEDAKETEAKDSTDSDSAQKESKVEDMSYGFRHGDTVTYHVEVINTGEDSIVATVSDGFEDLLGIDSQSDYAKFFEDLKYTDVTGEGVVWQNADDSRGTHDVNPVVSVEPGKVATIVISAVVSEEAPEYLAPAPLDDAVVAVGEGRAWTEVDSGRTVNVNPHDGYVNTAHTTDVHGPHGEPLPPKDDTANTPVQSNPSYDMRKYRFTDAPEKLGHGLYGFYQGDTVSYHVEIINTGDVTLTMDVSDSFTDKLGLDDKSDYIQFFTEPVWSGFEAEGATWNNENDVMGTSEPANITIKPQMKATLYLSSTVTKEAREYLAPNTLDDAVAAVGEGRAWTEVDSGRTVNVNPHDGYVNTASVDKVVGVDGTKLPPKDDTANTPVQISPKIRTTLTDGHANHNVLVGKLSLVDTISYENLVVGKTYKVEGQLMDKESGKPIDGAVASRTFVAEKTSGTIDVTFSVDATKLENHDLVAFEELYVRSDVKDESGNEKFVLITDHKDLNDPEQTVHINPENIITKTITRTVTTIKNVTRMPKTGTIAAGVFILAVGIGLALYRRKQVLEDSYSETE